MDFFIAIFKYLCFVPDLQKVSLREKQTRTFMEILEKSQNVNSRGNLRVRQSCLNSQIISGQLPNWCYFYCN